MTFARTIVICSHRLGGTDGVSIEAAKWKSALETLGHSVRTVAGEGTADLLVEGLRIDDAPPLFPDALAAAFLDADLVIVENICSLKLNPGAAALVGTLLAGRPAILHHHDLAVERADRRHLGPPPDDAAWQHVCISDHARDELGRFAIAATTIYNLFDPDPPPGDRTRTRRALRVAEDELLVLQPTRAIARKNIPAGVGLAESIGATYWLLGNPEDGYDGELDEVLRAARTRVIRRSDVPSPVGIDDAYAACDLVALPSTWEGFGNPTIESATHRRPLAIGDYPAAKELARFGFRWFSVADPHVVGAYFRHPDPDLIKLNAKIARTEFSLERLPSKLQALVSKAP